MRVKKAQTLNRAFCMGYRVFIKQTLTKHTQYISSGNKQAAKMVFFKVFPNIIGWLVVNVSILLLSHKLTQTFYAFITVRNGIKFA